MPQTAHPTGHCDGRCRPSEWKAATSRHPEFFSTRAAGKHHMFSRTMRATMNLPLVSVGMSMSDPDIVSPPAGGSRLGEEVVAWFDQYRGRLGRYLLSFGLSVADADEAIQETFLALFEHLRKGKPRDNLRGWLFRVAHNLALKQRQETRRDSMVRSPAAAIEE